MNTDRKTDRPKENIGLWYQELSKDIFMGGRVYIPRDVKDWPENWKTTEYKIYKYANKVKLPDPKDLTFNFGDLKSLLLNRHSKRNFKYLNHFITLPELSYLCKYGFGEFESDTQGQTENWKSGNYEKYFYRPHPSGGARYSLEYYICINRSKEIIRGIYHYNIKEHSLELLESFENKDFPNFFGYEWGADASCYVFVTSIFERNMRKYGERGYRHILQESGHVGQNLYLLATNINLSITAIAGTKDTLIEETLGVDGKRESLVYSLLVG